MAGRRVNVNVGVLGHIDSGKTALARALSTTASTAAFDKQPQSRERGITLDLGFSCFVVPLPGAEPGTDDLQLQVTLVDCPGHASLIRTIIGGERGPGREPGSGSELAGRDWPDSLGLATLPGGLGARTHSPRHERRSRLHCRAARCFPRKTVKETNPAKSVYAKVSKKVTIHLTFGLRILCPRHCSQRPMYRWFREKYTEMPANRGFEKIPAFLLLL